jgi:ferredoxin
MTNQAPMTNDELVIGAWSFFGHWDLGFGHSLFIGIWSFSPAGHMMREEEQRPFAWFLGSPRMTISIDEYYAAKEKPRKKEPQYLAFINRNSCTSCNSCATMCPVDCIYEIPGDPSEPCHVIDTSRCIGCQMCYRVPSESTGPWTMEICPWNAIDLIYNPNFKPRPSVWEPYFAGAGEPPNFAKLEELGYELYLNRVIRFRKGSEVGKQLAPFLKADWTWGEGQFAVLRPGTPHEHYDVYVCTEAGAELVDFLYRDYQHVFLD